jgi:hypothetical protein
MEFAVVAYIEIDFAKGVAGVGELLHGKFGGFVVHVLVEKSHAV